MAGLGAVAARLGRSVVVGDRRFPPPGLVALAALGAFLLAVVATTAWQYPTDEQAYWRAAARLAAGGSMYDATAVPGDASFGYWYPPPLAQVLAPLTAWISADVFSAAWTALLLLCLWWLAGRDVVATLALIAFVPVALELRVRNVHLLLAVLTVLAVRWNALLFVVATAIKATPVIGIVYLAGARRWRDAILVGVVGGAAVVASYALSPTSWGDFLALVVSQAGESGASILPIPFPLRFIAGGGLALAGGVLSARGRARPGDALLVIELVLANPTLWANTLSLLVAIVPLWRRPDAGSGGSTPAVATASSAR